MYTLTTPIDPPAINRCRVLEWIDNESGDMRVVVEVGNGAQARPYGSYHLFLSNSGESRGLRATSTPLGYSNYFEAFTDTIANVADNAAAAMTGSTRAQKRTQLETYLVSVGLLPAGS